MPRQTFTIKDHTLRLSEARLKNLLIHVYEKGQSNGETTFFLNVGNFLAGIFASFLVLLITEPENQQDSWLIAYTIVSFVVMLSVYIAHWWRKKEKQSNHSERDKCITEELNLIKSEAEETARNMDFLDISKPG